MVEIRSSLTVIAGLVRRLFTESIELARRYGDSGDKNDLYEALRLLGTGLHCLEGTLEFSKLARAEC